MTFDPRNAERGLPTNFPFVLFPKQIELVNWVNARWKSRDDGVIEKSRDIGMTWLAAAIAHWITFFHPGTVVGFGVKTNGVGYFASGATTGTYMGTQLTADTLFKARYAETGTASTTGGPWLVKVEYYYPQPGYSF